MENESQTETNSKKQPHPYVKWLILAVAILFGINIFLMVQWFNRPKSYDDMDSKYVKFELKLDSIKNKGRQLEENDNYLDSLITHKRSTTIINNNIKYDPKIKSLGSLSYDSAFSVFSAAIREESRSGR